MRILLIFFTALFTFAQPPSDWSKPFPAHRIIGNLYYVGTYDLACYYIVTPQGNILINTGLGDSVPLIKASVESLGFKLEDTRILLTMQAHYDHVAAMAEMKRLTHARLLATDGDAPLLEDGGKSDHLLTGPAYEFTPVKVDGRIADGQKISLGGTELTAHLHPGHTRGSVSYSVTIEGKHVLMANLGSINPGTVMFGNKKYPQIAEDYARTFREQKKLECDIFLAGHAQQYRLHDKWKPGQAYSPDTFVDPDGYKTAVAKSEAAYQEYLKTSPRP
ncbi:MAG TPA: subclass B3 metallo-beta-lactamase [Bryobacteraceae bacterium]|nr:subclass B3 metallo-beta-lactamase [Bryobacteraceae bacterium]